ncbi:hypothetical protein Baya_6332 [Bagarius yarrelli]|uniref:Uncharacterized protein n=1 Tax=Bagarius yarrelli TaxID=175774 RepID=A0A556TY24_BAGYA|nr:hypothetical protein Baya_6332 [Bagarius yarrelli]
MYIISIPWTRHTSPPDSHTMMYISPIHTMMYRSDRTPPLIPYYDVHQIGPDTSPDCTIGPDTSPDPIYRIGQTTTSITDVHPIGPDPTMIMCTYRSDRTPSPEFPYYDVHQIGTGHLSLIPYYDVHQIGPDTSDQTRPLIQYGTYYDVHQIGPGHVPYPIHMMYVHQIGPDTSHPYFIPSHTDEYIRSDRHIP